MRILLVEDEIRLATLLRRAVGEEGHVVDVAGSGEDALDLLDDPHPFDAIVLDIMLPGIDGLTVCRRLRERRVQTPVLLLTARDAVPDRVAGLDAGADDYLVKPFALSELLARLRALHRRPRTTHDPELRVGPLRLDPASRRVWRGAEEIVLPNKEFRMLEYFMRNPRRVLTRTMIADQLWEYDFPNVTNVIDVHIRSLRNRIGDPYPGGIIETVRGAGYRLRTDP
jgi:two-component system OmpR family response regulator